MGLKTILQTKTGNVEQVLWFGDISEQSDGQHCVNPLAISGVWFWTWILCWVLDTTV